MPRREASAEWEGTLKEGKGLVRVGRGSYEGRYSYVSRFEDGNGTNPEELIGAAHAGCYSMALAMALEQEGYRPEHIFTRAEVQLDTSGSAPSISGITLETSVSANGIEEEAFQRIAEQAKNGCPVSRALQAVPIELRAELAVPSR